jgi:LmbE family N-acetylglucosaminyl deacetylase
MNILVCASHPDDEILGMGSTIYKLASSGHCIACWFYFSGINCNGEQQKQPEEVANIIGTAYPPFIMPDTFDNESDVMPILQIARSIEATIEKVRPEVVYTHSGHDLNADHRCVFEAAMVATRPKPQSTINRLLSFEVPSSTEWGFGQFGLFNPNVFEEVDSACYQKKIEALHAYIHFIKKPPHPRSINKIDALLKHRGAQVGFDYAEAFELIWERR